MKKNITIIRVSVVIMILSSLVSVGVMMYLRVDKPLYIKNYCTYSVVDMDGKTTISEQPFVIQYIDNLGSKKEAIFITFKGYENEAFDVSEYSPQNFGFFYGDRRQIESVGPYGVHNVYVTIPADLDLENWTDITLTEATIWYNDETKQDVDLGKIVLTKENNKLGKLEFITGTSTSDGATMTNYNVTDDITITKVDSLEALDGNKFIKLNISGNSANEDFKSEYKQGDTLNVIGSFIGNTDILSKFTRYEVKNNMYYKDSEGNNYSQQIYNASYRPYYNFEDIVKYLKARGEL